MNIIRKQLTPRYYIIYEELYNDIRSGRYKEGDKLPSESSLCRTYDVSRGTAREAVKMLLQQGLLIREQGRGTFVTSQNKIGQDAQELMGFTELMRRHGKAAGGKLLKVDVQEPDRRVRDLLQLPETGTVVRVERLRLGDDEPLIIEQSYFVHDLFAPLLDFNLAKESIYAILYRETDIRLGDAEQTIEAALAGPSEAELLEIEPGSPLLLIKRRIKTDDGRYFQYSEDAYRSDKLRFTIHTAPYDEMGGRFSSPLWLAERSDM